MNSRNRIKYLKNNRLQEVAKGAMEWELLVLVESEDN